MVARVLAATDGWARQEVQGPELPRRGAGWARARTLQGVEHVLRRHAADARRGQLDGQRHAFQRVHQLDHGGAVGSVQMEFSA